MKANTKFARRLLKLQDATADQLSERILLNKAEKCVTECVTLL
jgi:hypothetical protein